MHRTGLASAVKMTAPSLTAGHLASGCPNPKFVTAVNRGIPSVLRNYFLIIYGVHVFEWLSDTSGAGEMSFLVELLDHGSQQWSKLQS